MNQKLQELAQQIDEIPSLKQKLKALSQEPTASIQDHVTLCQEYGIKITVNDLKIPSQPLSEEELEMVTGGMNEKRSRIDMEICNCSMFGSGKGIDLSGRMFKPCTCVTGGEGEASIFRCISDRSVGLPCTCVLMGVGVR